MNLLIGQEAPDFTLLDQNSKKHKLSNYLGSWVILYFYPRDNTPGCTIEACSFRDSFPRFDKINAKVLGISSDSIKSHASFAKKFRLPFSILADEDKKVLKLYGVLISKKFMGRDYKGTRRSTFLINPQGKIAKIYYDVKPQTHIKELITDLKNLAN